MGDHLTFDPDRHEYFYDGIPVIGVTSALERAGFTDFSHIPGPYRSAALARGRRVHQAAHYYIEGTLDWDTVSENDRPFVESCALFITTARPTFDGYERRLFHPRYRYAGTCDAFGWWDGHYAVMDWCTGDTWQSAKDLQCCAYSEALRAVPPAEWPDFQPAKDRIVRLGVRLMKSGAIGQPTPYADPQDFPRFLTALAVTREQERRGMRRRRAP